MYNPIEEKRRFVQAQIQKSFDSGINVAEEIDLEKAHKDGDHHPTKPWVWVSSANGGKGDWRVEGGRAHKKAGASTTNATAGSKVDITKIPDAEFKRITQTLEKKNPDHRDAERYLEEEAMSDKELKNFHAVAEHFKNSSKINKLTQEYCKKWAELARQELQSRNKKSNTKYDKDETETTKKRYNLNPDGTPIDMSKIEDDNLKFSIAIVKTNIKNLKNKLGQTSNGAVVTRKNLNSQIEEQEGKLLEMEEEMNKRVNSKSTTSKTKSSKATAQDNDTKLAKKVLELMRIKDDDVSKVEARKTTLGNWHMYYDGKDTGIVIMSSQLSENDLKKIGVLK